MKKNLSAKKSLGQNFLKSKIFLRKMINEAGNLNGETVLEIGPGKGVLTKELLNAGAKVIAVELDRRMISYLREVFSNELSDGKLRIVEGDILSFDLNEYIHEVHYSVIANIPYYITNAILRKFLEAERKPKKIILLVQKEVAQRIIARDGKESILSISVKIFGKVNYIAKVPRTAFSPQPKVDSAIISISNIQVPAWLIGREEEFFHCIRLAFSQRRKQMLNLLKKDYDSERLVGALRSCGISPKARAEDLSLEEWKCLFLSGVCQREKDE